MARIKQEATPNTAYASEEPEDGHIPDLELEQRTLRKFDLYVLPQFMILVLIAYLDRSNIGNARVFGFEEGLNLTSHQFNDISTVFYATYVLFEVPWVMAVKRYGANTVLGAALVLWSTVTLCTGFVQTYTQCLVMRLLLGAAEAGLFPALSFVISTIWDRQNQAKRVSLLYMSSALSGAFGKLFAYGVQSMGRQRRLDAWRWLFIIEGAISLLICSLIWFTLPKSAEEAWFLSSEEKAVMRARKARNALYTGSDEFDWRYVKQAFTDPFVYAAAALLFCSSIPFLASVHSWCPRYLTGNAIPLAMEVVACGGIGLVWLMLKKRDQKKERMLAAGEVDNGYGDEDRGLQFRYTL
ncbi:putative major facilitator superfamily, MFS transporter superfamily [Septoria linicola]|nr:putative major facilitator superfamily, MFS transporter superfamily [Septoria linicola]